MNKEAIKQIVLDRGKVSFPFKASFEDYFSDVKIFTSGLEENPDGKYIVLVQEGKFNYFHSIDKAVEFFCKKIFNKKNLALAYEGIRAHRLNNKDFDDLTNDEIENLCQIYWDNYYDEEYPEY
jgi:hypothetical protein